MSALPETTDGPTSARDRAEQLDRIESKLDDLLVFADEVREATEPLRALAQSGMNPAMLLGQMLRGG